MKTKLLFLSLLFAGIATSQTIALQQIATGFNGAVEMVHAGDSRFFIAQQSGAIRILNADGTTNATPFLNVSSIISSGGERGLLGLAFHPQYATNGYFYINYTNTSGSTVIARYSRDASNPSLANPASAQILMTIQQPFSNHNGGCLRFGPDGFLYISMGDGGSGGDPNNNGQNINYSVPASNPFVGAAGSDEIWAYGLRNAWKFSFDTVGNNIMIADVGQGAWEEINKVPVGEAGVNYGWRCYEGNAVYESDGCTDQSNYKMPVAQYSSGGAPHCSITGGYVYNGTAYPNLVGKYLFADYCSNQIGVMSANNTYTFTPAFPNNGFTTFGQGVDGELYIIGSSSGRVYRITDTSLSTVDVKGSSFAVYPNPASGAVNIRNNTSGNFATAVAIYDLSGKQIMSRKLSNTDINTIQTSQLSSGLYMMTITDSKGALSSHKLAID
ncbi:MAG: T9SS type A sorting domain-containing protein [Flavobacterium sp.]|nr:MAG: T9SS type A sorting domain-containing protein [Flavobacterium sp.]